MTEEQNCKIRSVFVMFPVCIFLVITVLWLPDLYHMNSIKPLVAKPVEKDKNSSLYHMNNFKPLVARPVEKAENSSVYHMNSIKPLVARPIEKAKNSSLSRILLCVNFNHPFYQNIPILQEYYSDVFHKIIYCGPEKSKTYDITIIDGARGHFGYMCVAMAIKSHPGFEGYMYVNDDMIVNWWTMINLPRSKIWFSKDIINEAGAEMDSPAPCCWHWWTSVGALANCKKSFDNMKNAVSSWNGESNMKDYYANTEGKRLCLRAWSDFMYLPQRLSQKFVILAEEFYRNGVFLEVATSTIITMLDKKANRINVDGVYLPDLYGDVDFSDGVSLAKIYSISKSLYHPVKIAASGISENLFKNLAMEYGKLYTKHLKALQVER